MGTPKITQDTSIPVGSIVRVINDGESYTTYGAMERFMKLTNLGPGPYNRVYLEEGEDYTVVAKALHERTEEGELLGLQDAEGRQFIIGIAGVRLIKTAKVSLSAQVVALEEELEAVKAERDALKAQLATIKAVVA